jgi:beta-galactosidase GanA
MKKTLLLLFLCCFVATGGRAQVSFPFPILGGELSNSAATSIADIDEVMPRMKALGLNTVLVPVYWELMEPTEGQFDFTLIDRTIAQARASQLKVILLWFGAWKNSMSCYAPGWFKRDTKRFPRAMTRSGKPLEIASAFSANVLQADNKAFGALMRRIAEQDP